MSNNPIENEAATPPHSSETTSNHRLLLVLFALLLLVCVPVLTSYEITQSHRRLRSAIVSERAHHARVSSPRLGAVGIKEQGTGDNTSGTVSASPSPARAISQTLDALDQQVESVETKIEELCTAQFWLALTLGALGLLAFNHTRHTIRAMRANVAALESLFETASHVSVHTAPEAMHGYLASRVATVLGSKQALLWRYDETGQRLVPLPPGYGFAPQALQNITVPVEAEGWATDLLRYNRVIRSRVFPRNEEARISAREAEESENERAPSEINKEENPDLAQNDVFIETLRALGATDALVVPLRAHGKPVGVLCAANKQAGAPFSDDDTRLLQTFAGQAAFVLNSAALYTRTLARSEQLAVLANITSGVNRSLELSESLSAFWEELARLLPFREAFLALVPAEADREGWAATEQTRAQDASGDEAESEETELTRRLRGRETQSPVSTRPDAETFAQGKGEADNDFPFGSYLEVWRAGSDGRITTPVLEPLARNPYAAWALQHNKPLVLSHNDAAETPNGLERATAPTDLARPAFGSVLVVPLMAQGVTLGVLQLESASPLAFEETQQLLLTQIAGTVAAAARNVRLYRESTHRAEQLEWAMQETQHRIKNNLQVVSSVLDIYLMDTAPSDAAAKGLRHALRQVRAITAVNDLLDRDARLGRVEAQTLLERLIPLLTADASARERQQVRITIEAGEARIPGKMATALALTVSEFFVNAIQHGGQQRDAVAILVRFERLPTALRLTVVDDGPGFPPDIVARMDSHVGLSLARTLIERDHAGQLTFTNNAAGGGASAVATIPFTSLPGWERKATAPATEPPAAHPQRAATSDAHGQPP